jgi:uncharacterized membrane protein
MKALAMIRTTLEAYVHGGRGMRQLSARTGRMRKERKMTLGPVQLFVLGLPNENLKGRIAQELDKASQSGMIRVLDALAIQKEQDGTVVSVGASDLTTDQRAEMGAIIGGLLGYGAAGDEGVKPGAEMGAVAFSENDFGLSADDIKNIAKDIPAGTTGVLVLIEHRWAVPLKEALQSTGGMVLAQGIVRAETLIAMGSRLAAADMAATQTDTSQSQQQMH